MFSFFCLFLPFCNPYACLRHRARQRRRPASQPPPGAPAGPEKAPPLRKAHPVQGQADILQGPRAQSGDDGQEVCQHAPFTAPVTGADRERRRPPLKPPQEADDMPSGAHIPPTGGRLLGDRLQGPVCVRWLSKMRHASPLEPLQTSPQKPARALPKNRKPGEKTAQ